MTAPDRYAAVWRVIHAWVAEHGGSYSPEGQARKAAAFVAVESALRDLEVRAVQEALSARAVDLCAELQRVHDMLQTQVIAPLRRGPGREGKT